MELIALLARIDANREKINSRRPLTTEEVKELDRYYMVGLTYTSNALEGNSLTLSETKVLLEDGITAGGKPIRDYYEASGHADAYTHMLSVARAETPAVSEETILKLHKLFYNGIDSEKAGRYRDHQVFISGTDYVPPEAKKVPALMQAYVREMEEQEKSLHPVLFAAYAHRRLVDIHPFTDGNGRTARLLMNLILVRNGYCIVSIPPVLRHDYISALISAQRAGNPTVEPFNKLIAECELEAQRDYGRMLHIPLKQKQEPELER